MSETDLQDVGGVLMFVRGASPERVMQAFGMDLRTARRLRAAEVYELPFRQEDETGAVLPWIRVGAVGEWVFAIDESSAGHGGYEEDAARDLSAGTDVAWFTQTMTIDYFRYYRDGTLVTSFEPLFAWRRRGTDPDLFVPAMRQAGLRVDPPADDAESPLVDDVIALLEMLTIALGIRLPADVALGPLLTVHR
jgi:hypothetical protein